MEKNIKIELTENTFDFLSKTLPENIIGKLKPIEAQVYNSFDVFSSILKGLLGDDFEEYKDTILNYAVQIESDEDTLQQDTYINENGKTSIYPYDLSKADIDIREDPQTVYELVKRKWDRDLIQMPDFQRKYVWKPEQQSLFIESVLLNFPLPPLYINKDTKGKYIVVDGRQRITTLRRFLKNEFKLQGLRAFPELNGKNFEELIAINSEYQTKIEDKKLLVYLIQPTVPMEMVYDIFNRINTGGTQLERQEIRNCIYLGKATDFLKKLAGKEIFKEAIDNGISDNRAKDQEAILRFLAFRIFDYTLEYKNSMNDFVENAMKHINGNYSNDKLLQLENEFDKAMQYTLDFFEKNNFRVPTENTRGRVNIAIFETVAGFFASKSEEFLLHNKAQIKANYSILIKNEAYIDAVRFSTGDKRRVTTRFDIAFDMLNLECENV
ncbi:MULTISPECIES: DUF262 domain-containing protein [Desulfobacula]|uniref:GmrSD restriction endonucleases N-terminal domain-containing protein n=2 Tax=Desulfobacula TaxID=28222 RepID=K0NCF6_DESTT|nr:MULTISPECIES: DUF262 domain-containing protein [Desulfobacula]CCK78340.1 uncharacterized protein TOL2_C01700 [Desulfobacula toluolica Tol2]SDU57721.1 Protein of unknown function DUF262 [Desulfobacula phenolica]